MRGRLIIFNSSYAFLSAAAYFTRSRNNNGSYSVTFVHKICLVGIAIKLVHAWVVDNRASVDRPFLSVTK